MPTFIEYLTAITLSEFYGLNNISRKVKFLSGRHLVIVEVESSIRKKLFSFVALTWLTIR